MVCQTFWKLWHFPNLCDTFTNADVMVEVAWVQLPNAAKLLFFIEKLDTTHTFSLAAVRLWNAIEAITL